MTFLRTILVATILVTSTTTGRGESPLDFNRDIRTILSNKCFTCHGPDDAERQAGLRLDLRDSAIAELESGETAIVPGDPDGSELLVRVKTDDGDLRMPPVDSGDPLSPEEIEKLTRWIREGAPYAKHWSYVAPVRPKLPQISDPKWARNPIDHFVLRRLDTLGLQPSPQADRFALVRRVSLDLTGLPPTLEEVEQFVDDKSPSAYADLIERVINKPSFGEHWARMWLDLARYADSAGYADDPPRTIWAFRDYVIRSFNENKPFDQFTIEQLAGDLLPSPSNDQLTATAFHRNTLTNNEGGTNDEEFRNVAIVDRVNTTMAVWMGTTISCAQCHNHKYDPISQKEYFEMFAIFNSTEDSDKRDERPRLDIFTDEQRREHEQWAARITELERLTTTSTPELAAAQQVWERKFAVEPSWSQFTDLSLQSKSSTTATTAEDGTVSIDSQADQDVYTVNIPITEDRKLTALQLATLPTNSNFVVTRVSASLEPPAGDRLPGKFIRIENTGNGQILSLAEVQVFSGAKNVALEGKAEQSSTDYDGPAKLAIDGNTNGDYQKKSTTHTATENNPWWEVELPETQPIDRIVIWNRTDNNLQSRLQNFRITVFDHDHQKVWEQMVAKAPNPSSEFTLSGVQAIEFVSAYADYEQAGFPAAGVLAQKNPNASGWAVGPEVDKPHQLTLLTKAARELPAGSTLQVQLEQLSSHPKHTLKKFRVGVTDDASVTTFAGTPANVLSAIKIEPAQRSPAQRATVTDHFLSITEALRSERAELDDLRKKLSAKKPATSVPIMRELKTPRKTKIQLRGNFLSTGDEVSPALPSAFHTLAANKDESPSRFDLANWLVDRNNPLTARVVANRYWEALFGVGLVSTSEEFGSQGELPSHPELLDWLAVELMDSGWDTQHLLKLIMSSATYQQSSKVTQAQFEADPDNRHLARGPRFRLSAEMIRDQALFVSGLLSSKMYGPPVKPPQPSIGLSAAFGSGIDWKTSTGDDKFRRGLYTTWRRSNPYPSMAAFDAPNREVCTVRRDRTNTPLQALVTLNDPVYVEAAQALSRRINEQEGSIQDKAAYGFRLCLSRPPSDSELKSLTGLFAKLQQRYADDKNLAMQMATNPLGPAPEGTNVADLAAWTVVSNVLLNLDEMFMKR